MNDLVIFISSSGNTNTLVKAADKFSYLNVKSVAITNNPGSPLFDLVDIGISATVQKASYEGYDVSARSTLVILADLIFDYYLKFKMKQ